MLKYSKNLGGGGDCTPDRQCKRSLQKFYVSKVLQDNSIDNAEDCMSVANGGKANKYKEILCTVHITTLEVQINKLQ